MKNSNIIKSNLNININRDDFLVNNFLYCWDIFSTRPSKILIDNSYSKILFDEKVGDKISEKVFYTEISQTKSDSIVNDLVFCKYNDNLYISFYVYDRNSDNSFISDLYFIYKDENSISDIQDFLDSISDCAVDFTEEPNQLNTLVVSQNIIEVEPVDISDISIEDYDKFYHKKTFKDIKKLVKSIKKSSKGLSVLYGERGSGKTSIINYISKNLDRMVIYIPNNMIELTINSIDFRKFIKRYNNPIFIVDDCEILFNSAFNKSNMLANNILQIIDGILSSDINLILIFNTDDEADIDESILECNNLIDVVRFNNLSAEEATSLSKYIGYDKKYKTESRVIDISKNRKDCIAEIGF